MNKVAIAIVAIVVIASGAFVILGGDDEVMSNSQNTVSEANLPVNSNPNTQSDEMPTEEPSNASTASSSGYVDYSGNVLADSSDTNRVLFFHAPWCSTCNYFEGQIEEKGVPEGITVIKIDYDSEEELKSKYGVTIQSTFVQLDAEGNVVETWPFASGLRDIQELYDAVI